MARLGLKRTNGRTKLYSEDSITHRRRNAAVKLAERMVGGRRVFRALDQYAKEKVMKGARRLQQAGASAGSAEVATEKSGFVYVIINPAWRGFVKIGRAYDPEARLTGYQTSCPYRDYKLAYAVYFEDCHAAEHTVHYVLDKWRRGGEWFFADVQEATEIIDRLRETTSCGQR